MQLQHTPVPARAAFGLACSLAIAGLVVVALAVGQGAFDRGYELRATFPSSSQGLFPDGGSSVKLRGVDVGEVRGIELMDDGRAEITLFIRDGIRIPTSALAAVEPLSIFGPKFVRIEPGAGETTGPFLGDGDEITRTRTQRELGDILASTTELFSHVDPMDIIVTVDAVAEGLAGMGPSIGRTVDASAALAAVAAAHEADIRRFLGDASTLAETFADHGDDILAISGNLDSLIATTLDEPERLDDLLGTTIGISERLSALLADNADNLDVTLRSVGTFVRDVRAEAGQVPELLDLLGTFFGRLADIIRMPGPADTQMAALRGFISLDLCYVYGVCPSSTGVSATSLPVEQAELLDARALQAISDAAPPSGPLAELATVLGAAP